MTANTEQERAEFHEWKLRDNPKYKQTDDSMQDRRDWLVWQAARRAPAQPQWPQFEKCQDAFDAAKNRYPQGNPLGGDHDWHWFQAGWNERAKRLNKG